MADRGTSFDRALAIVTAFEAAGETSAARMLLLTQIQDLIDAASAARAGASKGDLTMGDHFCIVWNPDGMRPPRFRHDTVDSATKEAIRLGTENPGQTFHVLENIGHAKTPAAVFTSVYPTHLVITDANLGFVTAGAATGRAVAFESTPNPHGDDIWQQFRNPRGATHILAEADYIPGVKDRDGDPAKDTMKRAAAEMIRLRGWLSRIDDCACRSGPMTHEQRQIIALACRQALGHQPVPKGNHGLPGFDEAGTADAGEKPWLPDGDGWVEWFGGDNPAPNNAVDALIREDREAKVFRQSGLVSAVWQWNWKGDGRDVVAYRVRPRVTAKENVARSLVHGIYKDGDRVRYTGRGPGQFLPDALGAIGIFREEGDSGFCAVDWGANFNDAPCSATHINNLEHETLPQFIAGDIVYIRDWPTRMPHEVLEFSGGHATLRPQAGPPTQPVKIQDMVLLVPVQRKGEKR